MEIFLDNLNKTIIIAKPIADSAAATVKINNENICPMISSIKIEKKTKFKFIDNNNSSIDIKMIIIFCRFKIIPNKPKQKRKKEKIKMFKIFITTLTN